MKKSISLIWIILLTTFSSFSQNFNKVYKATVYAYEYGSWVSKSSNFPEKMFIILDGSSVKITNQTESKYITYGQAIVRDNDDYDSRSWDAYDKDGDQCTFIIKKYHNSTYSNMVVMSVLYSKFAIEYIINR